ncbi:putative macrophage stimulating 1-like protein [Mercenaria mercenaria]|uniref:putative macrophage stimulating 1-like protein n=1 Tax=Mercenaria mercenaria TaxID=6596 RepID=UPI00234EAE27|nr:putative macrophage stimulating 1-like protein [Mercenaria mercenaria]
MKYTVLLQMCCILLFLCTQIVKLAMVTFTDYYKEDLFADMLCFSSAAKLTGIFPVLTKCAQKCSRTDGCLSFFYGKMSLECYIVYAVLTSRTGCVSKPGSSYYLRQADNFCYKYTQEDINKMDQSSVSEKSICESYPFHVHSLGNNQAYRGCSGCSCCQWKGCANGWYSRDYNGTWSQTKYGRTCQRWDSQTPHDHSRNSPSGFPVDKSVYDAHNYCRNPDYESGGLWCYTEDPSVRFEYCDIPKC